MKLVGLLERRLKLPDTLLHRWIRTGQIRLNGARTQPFTRVAAGDAVRLPPFAFSLATQAKKAAALAERRQGAVPQSKALPVEFLGEQDGIVAVYKPAGLPTHPGSKHPDSLVTRLHAHAAAGDFAPTPIHRLDRSTSGVLLVARTYQALRDTQELFKKRLGISKEYLAWVHGGWDRPAPLILRHWLSKQAVNGVEKMVASAVPGHGDEAVLAAFPLCQADGRTLVQVRLFTGRTHQIRVQLAAMGHPIIGDGKYGPGRDRAGLLLHSARVTLPGGASFTALPRWPEPYTVTRLPEPLEVDTAQVK